MGGTQSWLNCEGTYQTSSPVRTSDQANSAGGDPIIALMMLLGSMFGLLFLTALAHCGFLAWRGCRHRHRKHKPTPQTHFQQETDSQQLTTMTGAGPVVVLPRSAQEDALGDGDYNDDGENSTCSSSSLTSSESSLDSTTARIAAQVASRRRSRFLDLTGVNLTAAGGSNASGATRTPSPTASWHPNDGVPAPAGGVNFLKPPLPRGAYDNPAYDRRHNP